MLAEEDLLDHRLAVECVGDRLANPNVTERLRSRVQAVKADAEGGSPHVLVAGIADPVPAPRGHGALFEIALLELLTDLVGHLAREDAIDEPRQPGGAVKGVRVGGQNDLFSRLPANELERSGADRIGPECLALLLHDIPGHDPRVAHREHGHEGRQGLVQHHLDGVAVGRREARNGAGSSQDEVLRALDAREQVCRGGLGFGVQNPCERKDDIVGGHLTAVMELDALPERESPREAIPR